MLQAACIASQMGCQSVVFETDSVVLKQAISTEDYDMSMLGAIFREIKCLLRIGFKDVQVVSCPRSCNSVAYSLVAHGVLMEAGHYESWLGQFLEFVKDAVDGDSSILLY